MLRSKPLRNSLTYEADRFRRLTGPCMFLLFMVAGSLEAQLPVNIAPTLPIRDFTGSADLDVLGTRTSPPFLIITCLPQAPTGPSCQDFCAYNEPVVADLEADGENIQWYDVAAGGTPLAAETPLVTGHFYATQTVGERESLNRLDVTVTVTDPETPTGPSFQSFCAVDEPLVENLDPADSQIFWYLAAEGGSPLQGSQPLTPDTYYAGQIINGCESQTRLAVSVQITDPAPPTGPARQTFCAYDEPRVSDLTVSGENVLWYPAASGGSPLEPDAYLATGNYYASRAADGCESSERLEVSVEVGATPVTSVITGKEDPVCYETLLTYRVDLTPGSDYVWTVPDGAVIVSGGTGPENAVIEVSFGGTSGNMTVTETSLLGCTGTPVVLAVTLPECGPLADFAASETEACTDHEITFMDLSKETDEGTAYAWDFGQDAVPSTAATPGPHDVKYTSPGFKTVQLTVTGNIPNTLTRTGYILIYPEPVVNLGKDTTLCDGNSLLLDAGNFASYAWSTGAVTRSVLVYEGAGNVGVTVTDENGCQASDAIVILLCDPAELLGNIPNVITPNNDHINDAWVIQNIHLFPDVIILIYDRWGRLVFESDGGYDNDWYGTGPNGNDLPVGTYYYIIDLKIPGVGPIKGTISILR